MKKIFIGFIIAFALTLTSGICLTACGGNDPKKINVTMEQYSGDGISNVTLFAASKADFENADGDTDFGVFSNRGNIYSYGYTQTVDLRQGEYLAIVAMNLAESHVMLAGGFTGQAESDVQLEINGVVSNFYSTGIFSGSDMYIPFAGYQYWTFVGNDFFRMSEDDVMYTFSGDITVKLVGNATIKTYAPKVTLKNYDENNTKYNDLVFNIYKNESLLEYNGKTELSTLELKAAFEKEVEDKNATYYDKYKVVAYFENHAKFIPNYGSFAGSRSNLNDDLEIEFYEMDYFYANGQEIVLDFTAFDDVTVEELSMIPFEKWYWENSHFAIYDSMYEDGNYQFIVDGKAPQDTLTLLEYREANNLKVKTVVSELVAFILKDSSMTLVSGNMPGWSDNNYYTLTADDIEIGAEVADKPGYRYVTIDFGDYKCYRFNDYNKLTFRAHYGVSEGEGMYAYHPYNFNSLKQLQKVEFVNEGTENNGSEYFTEWDGLKSATDNMNQIPYLGDNYSDQWSDQDGCYYFGGEVELYLGRGGGPTGSSNDVNTLELTISREGEADITLTLTRATSLDQNWILEGSYDWITCEFDNDIYQTRLVIKSDKVTKVSGKVTITATNQ
ncbi:MAG: hypothetical protein J1G05_04510 [Clostridiales bacterium]|nr:hypothetical protein [Clostridiales bacterium]